MKDFFGVVFRRKAARLLHLYCVFAYILYGVSELIKKYSRQESVLSIFPFLGFCALAYGLVYLVCLLNLKVITSDPRNMWGIIRVYYAAYPIVYLFCSFFLSVPPEQMVFSLSVFGGVCRFVSKQYDQ